MKRKVIIILVILVVAVAAYFLFFHKKKKPHVKIVPDSELPVDPDAYEQAQDYAHGSEYLPNE